VIGSMQHSDLESLSAKQPSVGTRDADSRKGVYSGKDHAMGARRMSVWPCRGGGGAMAGLEGDVMSFDAQVTPSDAMSGASVLGRTPGAWSNLAQPARRRPGNAEAGDAGKHQAMDECTYR
jgi:hypothetical protein